MPLVVVGKSFPRHAKGLAWGRACPNRSVVGPSGEAERVGPSADPGEEVRLREAAEVIGGHLDDAALVHLARRHQAAPDQLPQPSGGRRVELVVVGPCGHPFGLSGVPNRR